MKSRVNQIKSECILSVGMIVKNEEKYLEKCLTALKPLLDAVPSELVVVDTGSTDRTVEIAGRFTDKVYDFEWVNDFSAARNFGLEKCVGEWFMFLDADDILDEDLSEMIGFFNNEKMREKYNRATYMTRDYLNPDGSKWSMFAQERIIKRFPGLHFVNPIHEFFSSHPLPCLRLKTFSHHWGYVYESPEQRETKRNRNLTLLKKELEKNPNSLRTYNNILNDLKDGGDSQEFEETLSKSLEIALKNPYVDTFSPVIIGKAAFAATEKKDYTLALEYIDKYFSLYKKMGEHPFCLDLEMCKVSCLEKLGKYDEAVKTYEDYLRLYELYTQEKMSDFGMGSVSVSFCEPEHYAKALNRRNQLKDFSNQNEFNEPPALDAQPIGVQYKQPSLQLDSGKFTDHEFINNATGEQLESALSELAQTLPDFVKLVLEKCTPENFSGSFKELLWVLLSLEKAVILAIDADLSRDEQAVLYTKFTQIAALFISNVYNPDLLNDSDIGVLPPLYRFGYYMTVAQQSLEDGNLKGYIHAMKQALANYPAMKDVVNFLLDEISKSL